MFSKKPIPILILGLLLVVLPLLAAACGTEPNRSASSAFCGFVYGDGENGNDATLHYILLPGETADLDDDENISFVPCNSRNYIINDGTKRDANNQPIGDNFDLLDVRTPTGVPITIALSAYWTLHQGESNMRRFYDECLKFNCASSNDESEDNNNSSVGWNDMLGENFWNALNRAARTAAEQVDDTIWSRDSSAQYKMLGELMTAEFKKEILAPLGHSEDMFCGSGSDWEDPSRPGEGEFICEPVRILIDEVNKGIIDADDSTEGALEVNAQRLRNAEAMYGDDAGEVLGQMDLLSMCLEAGLDQCTVNLIVGTEGTDTSVSVPTTPNSAPVPTPTPEEDEDD